MPDRQHHDDGQRVRDAVERTLRTGTARIRQTMDGPAGRVVATGTVDFARRRARAVLALPPHPDAPVPDAVTEVEMVIDGVDTYTAVIDRPGRFVHDRLANPAEGASAGDPGLLLDLLRGTTDASVVEHAELPDADWSALEVEIDLDRAMERAPDELRRQLREVIDGVGRDFRPRRARLHLDDTDRIRRIDIDIASHGQPAQRLDVELSNLGEDLVVALPDAASILDDREMADLSAELAERFGDEHLAPPTAPDTSQDHHP